MVDYSVIKDTLHSIYGLLDNVEGMIDESLELDVSLREVFKTETHMFLMYLAAVDGRISPEERDFMNYIFDTNISAQEYVSFIENNNVYSVEFEDKYPVSFQIITEFDKKMTALRSLGVTDIEPIGIFLYQFYSDLGKAFIECDGTVQLEIDELLNYLGKLNDKIQQQLVAGVVQNFDEGAALLTSGKKGASNSTFISNNNMIEYGQYGPSIYKVDVDIPAGEYKLYPEGSGYFAICSDPNCDRIIRNENFDGQAYIIISNGQFLELCRCYAVPIDKATMVDATSMYYGAGEYKVGIEIPSGEYRVMADAGTTGYYSIEVPIAGGERRIISNNCFGNVAYVSVQYGQILQLCRCSIRR